MKYKIVRTFNDRYTVYRRRWWSPMWRTLTTGGFRSTDEASRLIDNDVERRTYRKITVWRGDRK